MPPAQLVRVVTRRKGKIKASEYMLRPGENGLSLFSLTDNPGPDIILEAVHQAGKQGELTVAVFETAALRSLGLRLVQTPGGTPLEEINSIHWEARLSFWRRAWLFLRRRQVYDYFNETIVPSLLPLALPLD